MRYKELKYQDKILTEQAEIENILIKNGFNWILDAEIKDARLEITKETLVWNSGLWYNGDWYYGVFRHGEWRYGNWRNGVWYNGVWKDGFFNSGIIFGGQFINGEIKNGEIRGGKFYSMKIGKYVIRNDEKVQKKEIEDLEPVQVQLENKVNRFENFKLFEGKNYQLFRGAHGNEQLEKQLKEGYLSDSGEWESEIRKRLGIERAISATRNFDYAKNFMPVIEFDLNSLTNNFKVVPFSENLDYFIFYRQKKGKINFEKALKEKDKIFNKELWKYKTDRFESDFGIAEELIITDKIPIKYIKIIYLNENDDNESIKKILGELNIQFKEIDRYYNYAQSKLKRFKQFH